MSLTTRTPPSTDIDILTTDKPSLVSSMASGLIGSEILKIAADIRSMVADGKQICNLTVGDFSPREFRIPGFLETHIKEALRQGETNYPPSDGILPLRKAVQGFYEHWLGLQYPLESVLITGGSRPGIYAAYTAILDPGDIVVYPVPSWNNNHYCHLAGAEARPVTCREENAFLPTRKLLEEPIRGARMLALNSPLNPTGTAFTPDALETICDLVLEENAQRSSSERPLFLLYDQVYWMLTFGSTQHCNPVSLRPEMRPYTIFVDGISKAFAATGVRVGWTVAPEEITQRMASILGHVGAWAPRAEQCATAQLLNATDEIIKYQKEMKAGIQARLDALYKGISDLKSAGLPIDAIVPMGAIYLSTQFAVTGKKTPSGERLHTNEDIRKYLLQEAQLAVVPFQAFGKTENDGWFRLSVGAVSMNEISGMLPRLQRALGSLVG
ncbi:MAG: pyridoxal phosphate-dependent aminotransferase [Bacteroidota bacterium]